MKKDLRNKALKQLARIEGKDAEEVVKKEVKRIESVLQTETRYHLLGEALELLKEIAFRVSGDTITVLENFLNRLIQLEITYEESSAALDDRYREYYDNNALVRETLEVVERIRYHEPKRALRIFLDYSLSDIESVRKQAEQGLSYIAQYDLDIFWGGGEEFKGVGAAPQLMIIEEIQSFTKEEKEKFLLPINKLCYEMLSPTISGTTWSYKTVTFRTGSIPAAEAIKQVRVQALSILMDLYGLAKDVGQKAAIIASMQQATRTPTLAKYTDDVLSMISDNTVTILDFYKNLIHDEDLQIVQKIEHDTFWFYYHRFDDKIEKASLAVKAGIDSLSEYQIFKILIGFEGVFDEWSKKSVDTADEGKFEKIREMRTQKAKEYAESITPENFPAWSKRILEYCQIKSNDLATFPHFAEFLEHFAKTSPDLALELLKGQNDNLQWGVIPLLKGGWGTDQTDQYHALISEWTVQRKHLFYIARLFEHIEELDLVLLDQILSVAGETKDRDLSAQIISVAVKHYSADNKNLVRRLFLPAIKQLTDQAEGSWLFSTWYMRQLKDLLSDLSVEEYQVVLENLIHLKEIDYHAEEALCPIAEKYPEMVFEFFGKRLEQDELKNFDAVPYDFHKLGPALSQAPQKAIEIVKQWYDKDDKSGLFMYRGARLLKISFSEFPQAFSDALIDLVRTGEEGSLKFVISVLRNYEGQPFLHQVCKELVKALPSDSRYLTDVMIVLESTGVVSGEFGFAEAYSRKKDEIQEWKSDENEKVRQFSERYIHNLDQMIEAENKRAKEGIARRKFEWGVGDEAG